MLGRFFLPGLSLWFAVPALLAIEPVLNRTDRGFEPAMAELGLDHSVRVLGLILRRGVDVKLATVARNGQAVSGKRLRELLGLVAKAAGEAFEEVGALIAVLLEFDVNSPVVARRP